LSERTEVWQPTGAEPDEPEESGQSAETRSLPPVGAVDAPAESLPADTVVVDTVRPDTVVVDTVNADTVNADTVSGDTLAVNMLPAETVVVDRVVGDTAAVASRDAHTTVADPLAVDVPPVVTAPEPEPMEGPETAGRADGRATAAPPSQPAPTSVLPFPLAVTAALVGEYRWIEHTLFALLGRWVEDAPLASVQVHLDAQSMRHAWHAELWAERLPVLSRSDPDRLTVPSAPAATLFGVLGAAIPRTVAYAGDASAALPTDAEADHPGTLPRLAGLYRVVLPRLVVSYERHLAATAEPTDGPVIRALRLVLNDEIEDWRAGEQLIERLVTRPHDVAAVVDYQRHLESALVGAGGRSGLVRIPDSVSDR
jgi:hypothetical protein